MSQPVLLDLLGGLEDCSAERWRPVVGHPDYLVSDQGRVMSLKNGGRRILSPGWKAGYPQVYLQRDGKRYNRTIHRLVLEAFVGPPPEGHEACHLNGVRTDARLSNLKWGTHKENLSHRVLHGTAQRGEECPNSILTEAEVREIRRARAAGEATYKELGERFGVHVQTVASIMQGRSWRHLA